MGWLDPFADALSEIVRILPAAGGPVQPVGEDEEGNNLLIERADRADELIENYLGNMFDSVEDDITQNVFRRGNLDPDNVEDAINDAEGAALQTSIDAMAGAIGIELAGGTQIESHQTEIAQILSFLALDDILGARLQMLYEKGIAPALEADIARKTRSEYVSLQDAVEAQLRKKDSDSGWLSGMATYGIRPGDVPILEEVSLEAVEAEELMETPMQMGVYVDPDLVERNARRNGLPEEVISLFVEAAEAMPRSADMWEQKTATEPVVSEIDTLVSDGELSPAEARNLVPAEAADAEIALRDRWRNISELPNKAPTRSQLETWFGWGQINRRTLIDGLRRTDVDPEKYPAVIAENILSELDGDLRTALGVGIIDENYYTSLARTAGLEQDVIEQLLSGTDLDDIGKAKTAEKVNQTDRPTTAVIDIGQSRAAGLSGVGIDNVGELANASVSDIAAGAALTDEAAATIKQRAGSMVS